MRATSPFALRSAGAALLACALPACFSVPSFPNQRDVRELRVLAIKADPPLVAPGGTVALTALVVDAHGPVAGADYRWWRCGESGGSEGSASCGRDDRGAQQVGNAAQASYTAPEGVLDERGRSIFVTWYGYRDVVNLGVSHGGEEAQAFKRVQVQRGAGNRNPSLAGILVEGADVAGAAVSVRPGAKYAVSPAVGAGSRETFSVLDFSGRSQTLTEELEFSWYATGGSLSDGVTVEGKQAAAHWTAPDKPPADGEPLWLFAIVYDGRGGTDWWAQEIRVGP